MQKYGIRITQSAPGAGYGLFTVANLQAGVNMPIKGPWFSSLDALQEILSVASTQLPRNRLLGV